MKENDVVVAVNDSDLITIPLSIVRLSVTLIKIFNDYMNLKYNKNENAISTNYQNELEYTFNLGLREANRALYSNNSPLLHKEKKPRKDVWHNLGKITDELVKCNSYPIIHASYLASILNKSLGNRDKRVIQDYRKTVLSHCNITEESIEKCNNSKLGELDVAFFVSLIPKQYRNRLSLATSSTSSFGDNEHER